MNARLKSLTAIFLAVLYGLVGFTGEGLHYLVENIRAAASSENLGGSGGYFHSHQPDHHVHFHHHHHDEIQTAQQNISENLETGESIQQGEGFHYLHACPLLTLISQLKLGQAGLVLATVDFGSHHSSVSDFCLCHAFEVASYTRARGPPAPGFRA